MLGALSFLGVLLRSAIELLRDGVASGILNVSDCRALPKVCAARVSCLAFCCQQPKMRTFSSSALVFSLLTWSLSMMKKHQVPSSEKSFHLLKGPYSCHKWWLFMTIVIISLLLTLTQRRTRRVMWPHGYNSCQQQLHLETSCPRPAP